MSRQTVETLDYIAFARRVIRAAGQRCAEADDFELAELITLRDDVEEAITRAVVGLREELTAVAPGNNTDRGAVASAMGVPTTWLVATGCCGLTTMLRCL